MYLLTGQVVELFVSAEAVSVPYNLQTSKMILQVYHLATVKSKNYKSKLINQLITIFFKNVIELEQFLLNRKNITLIVSLQTLRNLFIVILKNRFSDKMLPLR